MQKILAVLMVLSVSGCSSNDKNIAIKNSGSKIEKTTSGLPHNYSQVPEAHKKNTSEPSLREHVAKSQSEKEEQRNRAAQYQTMSQEQKAKSYGGSSSTSAMPPRF